MKEIEEDKENILEELRKYRTKKALRVNKGSKAVSNRGNKVNIE